MGQSGRPGRGARSALGKARYEAVTVVHSETSTGTLNDLEAIARAVREASDAFVLRRRRDLARRLAGRVRRVGPRLRARGLAEGAGASAGPRRGVRVRPLPRARARALPRALPAPLGGRGVRGEAPDAVHALDAAPLRARRAARPHPAGDDRGPLGAPRRHAAARRSLGRRARPRASRRPRARAPGPSRA